jgi:hypothetical protein
MITVIVPSRPETKRDFVGRAWANLTKDGKAYVESLSDKDKAKFAEIVQQVLGFHYLNIKLDQDVQLKDVDNSATFQLWLNKKRDGKKDADMRLSILTPVVEKA